MTFEGAVVKEQGITFAIVIVKPHVVQSPFEATRFINGFGARAFPGMPVVLMAQNYRGVPTYYGRRDIVNFLANTVVAAIPWRQYTIS
ncbi:MAG: hypothetical protein H8F28_12180 [Fibrella sp.]|nr:hypothetical protein [Armatimonadota bacterium]